MLEPIASIVVSGVDRMVSLRASPEQLARLRTMDGKDVHTLPDLLAALRQVTPEMIEAGGKAITPFPVSHQTEMAKHVFLSMLSAFERQMEGEK